MGAFPDYNYFDHARPLDVVAWDWYPNYGDRDAMHRLAVRESFTHELMRGVGGGKPWMLMESSPSNTNWFNPQKLKAPGQHALECLQAIAHGADTVQYFQWRKSLGGCEQFHGAVVDHAGHGGTRVFREVAAVGEMLAKLAPVRGTRPDAEVAIVYDPEVRWALEGGVGHGDAQKDYVGQAAAHYLPLWRRGLGVDVVRSAASLEGYKLAIAPMVHMLLPGVAESWRRYVEGGGVLLATYLTGYVGPSTLCLRGGWPGAGLRELFGVWNEEIDTLFDDMPQGVKLRGGALTGAPEVLSAGVYCERLHAESAEILGVYTEQFYAGEPALTRRPVGDRGGQAWYLGTRLDEPGLDGLTATLLDEAGVTPVLPEPAPEGVMARRRIAGDEGYLFLLNFKRDRQTVAVGHVGGADLLTGEAVGERFELPGYGGAVIATARSSAR